MEVTGESSSCPGRFTPGEWCGGGEKSVLFTHMRGAARDQHAVCVPLQIDNPLFYQELKTSQLQTNQ